MPVARLPLLLTVATFALFVAGNVLGWVTHDPQTAGSWGGGGSPALAVISVALFMFAVVGALVASRHPANAIGWLLIAVVCAIPGLRYSNACGHNAYVWLIITAPLSYVASAMAIYRLIRKAGVRSAE